MATIHPVIDKFTRYLSDEQFQNAMSDFISENQLIGEFVIWIQKWKSIHGIQDAEGVQINEHNHEQYPK